MREQAPAPSTQEQASFLLPEVHGARELPSVIVDGYSLQLRDKDGFIGDQASQTLLSIQMKNRGEGVSEEEKAQRLAEIKARYAAAMNPRYAAARLWVDAIIDPASTRQVLAASLAAVAENPDIPPFRTGVLQT